MTQSFKAVWIDKGWTFRSLGSFRDSCKMIGPVLLGPFASSFGLVGSYTPFGFLRKATGLRNLTWVSVQDVVLNKLRPSTQPSQPLPEPSHFYHNTQEKCLLMSLWFLLVCHALTQNDAESPVSIFLPTSQKRSKTHVVTKSLYIKTWFVCLNKFECLKTVETFQAPKHDS